MLNSTPPIASGFALQSQASGKSRKPAALKFSLAHLTVLGCAPPQATYVAARAGYDFVSYRTISLGLANEPTHELAHNNVMLRQTKRALAETGLKLHDIELARIADGIEVRSYLPGLETAAELGARHVISSIWTPKRSYAMDRLAELCDLAKTLGLTINLEFVTWACVANLQEAIAVCRAVDRENCGILVDTLHFHRSRVRLDELDAVPRELFHFAHVCDAPKEIPLTADGLMHTAREARLDLGEGGIDIGAILDRLPEMPYSLEVPNLERAKELGYLEHARRCLANARTYLSAHSRAQPLMQV